MLKIGVYGGAFNPPHNGHVNFAVSAKEALGLDKMVIMPTNVSPHKGQASVGFFGRENMCHLAFGHLPGFEISGIEGKITENNYTLNTLRILKRQYPPNADYFLLIGADMLLYFDKWYEYKKLMKESNVIAAAREKGQLEQLKERAKKLGRIKVLNLKVTEVSSSEIREKIAKGEDVSGLIPEKVLDYIKQRKYYL